eukprot:CAMPEP_0172692724 /NCGR_PEP_ID=MMETSP1074-20121228/25466_1 /TAXON_ID=2916 /ORGANISM="Ceratium fusus, Strain PA161109" /LENGTH=633 /DNA_ID=CAMNT_0013512989 /DNA_START=229 /DNA_END=2130 /DNA_ORIENTATION=-
MWHEEGRGDGSKTVPAYCEDPAAYVYRQGDTFSYEPTTCKPLPSQEAVAATDSHNGLFVATYVDDVMVWEGTGNECGAAARQTCSDMAGNAVPVYNEVEGSSRCSCSLHEQFLVEHPEEQRIRLAYGYEVDLSYGKRTDLRRGGIISSANSIGSQNDLREQPSNDQTIFLAPNGEECEFGGKSQWEQSDSVGGISGTLGELLKCAGVTLDSDPAKLASGTLQGSPHLRTMGFRIDLHLDIQYNFFGDSEVHVRAAAVPVASIMSSNDVKVSTFPAMNGSSLSHNVRRVHGVAISMPVMTGEMFTFDWLYFLSGFVDIAVVMQIPRVLMRIIAMYCLGMTSEVYRGTARTKFNLFNKFHGAVAQLMLGEIAFRGLVGNWHSRMTDLSTLTPQIFHARLRDIFCDHSTSGDLLDEELEKMANVTFTVMDKDNDGVIGCSEFIDAVTESADINMQRLAMYYSNKQDQGLLSRLRRVFDDTHHVKERKSMAANQILSGFHVDLSAMNEKCAVVGSTPEKRDDTGLQACSLDDALAKLEWRMHDLERQTEHALFSLKRSIAQSSRSETSPGLRMHPVSFRFDQPDCPVLSRLPPSMAELMHSEDMPQPAESELQPTTAREFPSLPADFPNPSIAKEPA